METTTLTQAHEGPDASYRGDKGDWMIVLAKSRDTDVMARANWDAALDLLKPMPHGYIGNNNADDFDVESSGHWAFGHVEFLVVKPGTKAHEIGLCILASIADYPVLDDELYSQYEHDATAELWPELPLRERIEYLNKHGESIFAARVQTSGELYERAPDTYYYVQLLATE